ncbi:hypothetical protein D9M71_575730 [compost metagenome]
MKGGLVLLAGLLQLLVITLIVLGLTGRRRQLLLQRQAPGLQGQQGFLIRPRVFHHGNLLALGKRHPRLDRQGTHHAINRRGQQNHRRIQNRPGGRG